MNEQLPPTRAPANSPPATTPAERNFARRALIAVGIATVVAVLALFLWYSMYVLLLAFAAVLVGVLLRGAAEWVGQKTGIGPGWGLGVVVFALVAFFAVLGLFAAPNIVQQVEKLADRIPQSLRQAEDSLRRYSWGRRLLADDTPQAAQSPSQATRQQAGPGAQTQPSTAPASRPASRPSSAQAQPPATQPGGQGQVAQPGGQQPTLVGRVVEAGTGPAAMQRATRLANRVLQGLLALFVVLVSGIYLAAAPRMYVKGVLHLVPHARRPRYGEVLQRLAFTIRWWMIGQLVPMAVIGVLTAIGLKIIGIELWFILGLLAALFNFVPNFGPLISGVPAFLLALADSPTKALWVVGLYVVAQSLEGYVLTPLVQRRAVELPPALLILFQVLAGLLLGALGVVLAAPLLAVVVVAVKMLYVEDVMGDEAHVPGDDRPEPAPPA